MPDEVMTITKLLAVTFWKQCWLTTVFFFCNIMPHRLVIDVVEAKGFSRTSHIRTLVFKFYKIHECFKQAIFQNFLQKRIQKLNISHDKWDSVTTARRVLSLRMEERPPVWKVAATLFSKQLGAADKGWSSMYLGPGLSFDTTQAIEKRKDAGVDGIITIGWIFRKWDGRSIDWIYLAKDRDRWRALIKVVMNLRDP